MSTVAVKEALQYRHTQWRDLCCDAGGEHCRARLSKYDHRALAGEEGGMLCVCVCVCECVFARARKRERGSNHGNCAITGELGGMHTKRAQQKSPKDLIDNQKRLSDHAHILSPRKRGGEEVEREGGREGGRE